MAVDRQDPASEQPALVDDLTRFPRGVGEGAEVRRMGHPQERPQLGVHAVHRRHERPHVGGVRSQPRAEREIDHRASDHRPEGYGGTTLVRRPQHPNISVLGMADRVMRDLPSPVQWIRVAARSMRSRIWSTQPVAITQVTPTSAYASSSLSLGTPVWLMATSNGPASGARNDAISATAERTS